MQLPPAAVVCNCHLSPAAPEPRHPELGALREAPRHIPRCILRGRLSWDLGTGALGAGCLLVHKGGSLLADHKGGLSHSVHTGMDPSFWFTLPRPGTKNNHASPIRQMVCPSPTLAFVKPIVKNPLWNLKCTSFVECFVKPYL